MTDYLENYDIKVFGPSKVAAQLEGSKIFTKNICKKYNIPTANFGVFNDITEAKKFLDNSNFPIVIKADNLAAGKGVYICENKQESIQAVKEIFEGKFGEAKNVLIEEFLKGEEMSFFIISDGITFKNFGTAQDHKKVLEGDKGKNTGGMGAYSPSRLINNELDEWIISDIIESVLPLLDSLKDLRRKELLEKIKNDLTKKIGIDEDKIKITGILVLYNNMLQSLFKSQILTLGVVMIGIGFMLVILFRSLQLAIIGIIPNLFAAAIILGLMGLLKIPLDMMTITIAAITIGIAVDNSIHYIYRFREEFPKTKNYIYTMHYCHANIGKAVFYTASTIIIGFSILVLSNFIPTIYFGLLTAFAMFIALFAALTLLPKLILIFRPFG